MKIIQINNNEPNFKSIVKVNKSGVFANRPELADKIVKSLNTNTATKNFVNKWNVTVDLKTKKGGLSNFPRASVELIFYRPDSNKFKNFMNSVFIHYGIKVQEIAQSCEQAAEDLMSNGPIQLDAKIRSFEQSHADC